MSNFPAEKLGEHEKRVAEGLDPVLPGPVTIQPVGEAVPVELPAPKPAAVKKAAVVAEKEPVKKVSLDIPKGSGKPAAKPVNVAAPVKRSKRK